MSDYSAPTKDMRFVLNHIAGLGELASFEAYQEATPDLVDAVLEEASKLARDVIAPLNTVGDAQGSVLENGAVKTPDGFKEAYRQYVEGGWNGLAFDPGFGGQGLPFVLGLAVQEAITSANMSFSLCPMLNVGAVEAVTAHGSDALKATYLEKMIAGEWTGTMNLTEPQAGSDVGALKTKAEPQADGSYRIKGTKIFITYGDHDMAENVLHLVLARLPGAPAGTKGISLFLVPKYLVNEDGSPGAANDLKCVSVEHKLGIHASPTCVMSFGDNDNCVGYLIGEENRGMACMFTMMNNARINVGLQGVAIAERAYQHALAYAQERVQGAAIDDPERKPATIIHHADVRRMLMTMKAMTEACRAIVYRTAAAVDRSHHAPDEEARRAAEGEADLLTPIAKAFSTDMGVEIASLGVQVHGGMGFVEETGAAQHLRDARIAPIYEGTNGIQALDLVGRKLNMAGGAHWKKLLEEMRDFALDLRGDNQLAGFGPYLEDGVDALENASQWLVSNGVDGLRDTAGAATPYLKMFGTVLGGYLMARSAQAAQAELGNGGDGAFLNAKLATARFYMEQIMPQAAALLGPVTRGSEALFAIPEEHMLAS